MTKLILAIDQTPSRASYGLLTQEAFRRELAATQKQAVLDNIARFAAQGDRMVHIETKENVIVELSAEAYLSEPRAEIAIKQIERPDFRVAEVSGAFVNIFI